MLRRLAILGLILALAGYGANMLLSALPTPIHGDPRLGEDSWRRTRNGWERFSPRVVELNCPAPTITAERRTWRLDFHPALLSLLIGLGTAGACRLLPRDHGVIAQRKSQTLF